MRFMMTATMVLLIGTLLATGVACKKSDNIQKPGVAYLPAGWYLTADEPYGTYQDDGLRSGLVEYTNSWNNDLIQLWYGDKPASLAGKESDANALIAQAVNEAIFSPDDTGNIYVAGRSAGYAEAYDPYWDSWETEIVFIYGDTYVDIYAIYDNEESGINDLMAIIQSIFFK